jgi:hypothetical protein
MLIGLNLGEYSYFGRNRLIDASTPSPEYRSVFMSTTEALPDTKSDIAQPSLSKCMINFFLAFVV